MCVHTHMREDMFVQVCSCRPAVRACQQTFEFEFYKAVINSIQLPHSLTHSLTHSTDHSSNDSYMLTYIYIYVCIYIYIHIHIYT